MPFVAAPGTAQFVLAGTFANSEVVVNVIHLQRKNDAAFLPWTQSELNNASLRLGVAWQRLVPLISNNVRYSEIRSRDMGSETGAVNLLSVAYQGGQSNPPIPPSNSLLIQWRTGAAGRGANGRSYLPGPVEVLTDDLGRLQENYRNDLTIAAQGVLTDLGAASTALLPGPPLDLVILHRPKGSPQTRSATPVITGRASNLIATQRRRLPQRT